MLRNFTWLHALDRQSTGCWCSRCALHNSTCQQRLLWFHFHLCACTRLCCCHGLEPLQIDDTYAELRLLDGRTQRHRAAMGKDRASKSGARAEVNTRIPPGQRDDGIPGKSTPAFTAVPTDGNANHAILQPRGDHSSHTAPKRSGGQQKR